jgi:hypothetical protein
MAAAGCINAPSNVLLKTELSALVATAFHADLGIQMVVWAGWLTHRAAQAAAIKPQVVAC